MEGGSQGLITPYKVKGLMRPHKRPHKAFGFLGPCQALKGLVKPYEAFIRLFEALQDFMKLYKAL